jgi:hypothetical protein
LLAVVVAARKMLLLSPVVAVVLVAIKLLQDLQLRQQPTQ